MIEGEELYRLITAKPEMTYSITHTADFDGVGSAAIIVNYTKMPLDHIFFIGYTKEDIESAHRWISDIRPSGSTVIFTDISANDTLLPYIIRLLGEIRSNGNTIAWIDHHPWSDTAIKEIREYCDLIICGENEKYCAAELTYQIMSYGGNSAEPIAKTAHLTDFNLRTEKNKGLLDKLACTITFINHNYSGSDRMRELRRMTGIISGCDFDNEFINETFEAYTVEAERNLVLLNQNAESFQAGRYRIGIGYGKNIHTNAACALIQDKLDADISVMIFTDTGQISFRSRKGVDCSPIARAFGGNGHPNAAGANPERHNLGIEEVDALKREIVRIASSIYAM